MDCRITLEPNENFHSLLAKCLKENQKAELLLDVNGLERASGYVQSLTVDQVVLDNGHTIDIKTIVALNGSFAESYSGC